MMNSVRRTLKGLKAILMSSSGEIAGLDIVIFGTATILIIAALLLSTLKIVETKQRLEELTNSVARELVLNPSADALSRSQQIASFLAPDLGLPVGTWQINVVNVGGPCGVLTVSASASTQVSFLDWPAHLGVPVSLQSQSRIPTDAYRYAMGGGVSCVAP